MRIQFRRWDGRGNPHDPKTGTPMSATTDSLYARLHGKTVSGIGGVAPGASSFMISFQDGPDLYFETEGGPVRILIYEHS